MGIEGENGGRLQKEENGRKLDTQRTNLSDLKKAGKAEISETVGLDQGAQKEEGPNNVSRER